MTPVGLVDQLHHRGDRGVELEVALDVAGDLVDRPVGLRRAARAPASRCTAADAPTRPRLGALGDLLLQPPKAGEEAVHALDALVGPVAAALAGGPMKQT